MRKQQTPREIQKTNQENAPNYRHKLNYTKATKPKWKLQNIEARCELQACDVVYVDNKLTVDCVQRSELFDNI